MSEIIDAIRDVVAEDMATRVSTAALTPDEILHMADEIARLARLYEIGKITVTEWIDAVDAAQLAAMVERMRAESEGG